MQAGVERRVDRLFHRAIRCGASIAECKERWGSYAVVDVAQSDGGEIARQRPTAAMPFFRPNIALLAQARHHPPDYDGIGLHDARERFGCDRAWPLRHMQKDVQDAG